MNDFASLSLNDKPTPSSPVNTEHNKILESETMENLLINIYIYDNHSSSFEELQQKMTDFYIEEANDECILIHFLSTVELLNEIEYNYIHEQILKIYYDEKDYYLLFNIKYITSPIGSNHLKLIYETKCLMI
jgi:hypothetical protein